MISKECNPKEIFVLIIGIYITLKNLIIFFIESLDLYKNENSLIILLFNLLKNGNGIIKTPKYNFFKKKYC